MIAALLNGQPATAEDLRPLALANYGHYTSLQVRGGGVQGLELHRDRLQQANRELFSTDLDFEAVRAQLREAARLSPDCTLRCTVFARGFDYRDAAADLVPDVLVTWTPPAAARPEALQVKSFRFQRPLPHIKHVGVFPLFHYRRLARQAGCDDALFVDADQAVSEGSVWNLGLWDGSRIVWPAAPALRGTSEQLLKNGLQAMDIAQETRPVALSGLGRFRAAFTSNASGVQPIACIDETRFAMDAGLRELLDQALARHPWEPL